LNAYLDTSIVVPIIVLDKLTERARTFLQSGEISLIVSDFAGA
jgi:hypothetical protein